MRCILRVAVLLFVLAAAHTHAADLPTVKPESVGLSSEKLAKVTELMSRQVAEAKLAGGVVVVARRGKIAFFESYGKRNLASGEGELVNSIRDIEQLPGVISASMVFHQID